jgi:hypothetical protein
MLNKTTLWAIGVGALGAVVGFQLGTLSAAPRLPSSPSPLPVVSTPGAVFAAPRVDVAELAVQLRGELAASLRRELGIELREALETEFAQALEQISQLQPAAELPVSETLTQEERETRKLVFEDALEMVSDAQLRGRFEPESRDELSALLPDLDPDDQSELLRQLSVALNEGTIHFDDPDELPF